MHANSNIPQYLPQKAATYLTLYKVIYVFFDFDRKEQLKNR